MNGPADKVQPGKTPQAQRQWILGTWLCRIGSDDLEIMFIPEGQESISSASARMHATVRGAHSCSSFHEGDTLIQIATAEKNVIKIRRHLVFQLGAQTKGRQGACACKKERTPRQQG